MKLEELPQDQSALVGYTRELYYGKDKDGKFRTGLSTGWEVKTSALEVAWDEVKESLMEAEELVRSGKRSPIYYLMVKKLMNISILSGYTGMNRLRVWWHLRPAVYRRLRDKVLARYAEALDMSVEEIRNLKL